MELKLHKSQNIRNLQQHGNLLSCEFYTFPQLKGISDDGGFVYVEAFEGEMHLERAETCLSHCSSIQSCRLYKNKQKGQPTVIQQ